MNWFKGMLALGAVTFGLVGCGGGGGDSGSSVFPPAGGASGTVATASDVVITLGTSSLMDAASSVLPVTVTAVDTNRNAVAGIPITLSVDSGAIVTASATETDATGALTATVSPGADRSNRTITLTATSGDITTTKLIQVTGATIAAQVLPSTYFAAGDTGSIKYTVADSGGQSLGGVAVDVSGDGVTAADDKTADDGTYTYHFTAPSTPGQFKVTAIIAGAPNTQTLTVQAANSVVPPATAGSVLASSVSINPSVVTVNTEGDSTNQVQVRALFSGANNARIANVRVRFDLDNDPNSIGGTLASNQGGTGVVYSDINGDATTSYIPSVIASPTNGVTVRACWDYNDFTAGTCPHQATATLTVVSQALRVSIGTDQTIGTNPGTYYKDYVILVVDSAGNAKAGVQITPSLDLTAFYKGVFVVVGDKWIQQEDTNDGPYVWSDTDGWEDQYPVGNTACPNEDHNRNGVLESVGGANEDLNGNSVLDPSGVTLTSIDYTSNEPVSGSNAVTDENGRAKVRMEYTRDRAFWIDFKITVTASVAGSEGKAMYVGSRYGVGSLPALATDITNVDVTPAFSVSPYGRLPGCDNTN